MAGYSATPLAKKLGWQPGLQAVVIDPPLPYRDLLQTDADPTVAQPGDPIPHGTGFVHLFTAYSTVLTAVLTAARPALAPAGLIWVSWPKKASRLPCDFTEDTIREIALPMGLVDIKVCAVNDIWSGLKLVIRRNLR